MWPFSKKPQAPDPIFFERGHACEDMHLSCLPNSGICPKCGKPTKPAVLAVRYGTGPFAAFPFPVRFERWFS